MFTTGRQLFEPRARSEFVRVEQAVLRFTLAELLRRGARRGDHHHSKYRVGVTFELFEGSSGFRDEPPRPGEALRHKPFANCPSAPAPPLASLSNPASRTRLRQAKRFQLPRPRAVLLLFKRAAAPFDSRPSPWVRTCLARPSTRLSFWRRRQGNQQCGSGPKRRMTKVDSIASGPPILRFTWPGRVPFSKAFPIGWHPPHPAPVFRARLLLHHPSQPLPPRGGGARIGGITIASSGTIT